MNAHERAVRVVYSALYIGYSRHSARVRASIGNLSSALSQIGFTVVIDNDTSDPFSSLVS